MRWTSLPLRVKGLVVVAIPLIALGVITAVLYNGQRSINEEQEAAAEIARVRSQIQTVLTLLLNAETGVRGYDLSEDRDFLEPYEVAFDRLPEALTNLETLTGDDPEQLARAQHVRFLTGRKLEALAGIRGTAFGEVNTPTQEELLAEDQRAMDLLREELETMQSVEEAALDQRLDALREARASQPYVLGIAIALGLAGGLFAMWLFTTGISHRVKRLEESARRLAKGEPLLERPPGSDEVGRLAQALQDASDLLNDREQKLVAAKETAELASSAKSEFLSRTSHELRTPLTAIRGLAMTLHSMDDLDTDLVRESLGRIVHASENLTRLLNDFLDISRIEAGVLDVEIEPVALQKLLPGTIDLMAPQAREKGIAIELSGEDSVPPVLADPQRVEQILFNLVGNAIKYNSEGAQIEVSCTTPNDDRVRICVSDNGAGIEADKLPRLFTPYDRLGAERTAVKGLGLGLPIAKSLAEFMNGELGVESVPGMKTTFWVELPAAA
ncbi:MAG: CHASE3 domain-containing protein [Actinobacteria bacterium]|nr:CHASE3 domain-containing protein [Actinomycetota bacterium]